MVNDELRELTSSIDFNAPYEEVKGHREIYDHVKTLSPLDPSAAMPPPHLVFYAARNILFPSPILGQIPDLLDLLTTVETFRRFAALKSSEALDWQTYFEREKAHGHEEDVRLLAAGEVRVLRRFLGKTDAQRWEYISLVRNLIRLHLHYLWTAPESCLLPKRLNDFFPGSVQDVDKPSELLFHIDLSEDEEKFFERLKVDCQEWMNLVVTWEDKRDEICRNEGLSEEDTEATYAEDFRTTFSLPFQPLEMVRNVEIYLNKVEDIVQKLELWFPPSGE